MGRNGSVIGWKLDRAERERLLARFPPRYAEEVADHVTLAVDARERPLPGPVDALIVGHADDGAGVEAMVVALDGSTDRPDGSTFHVSWSLEPGRRAKESNQVIAGHGWKPVDPPIPLTLEPARF